MRGIAAYKSSNVQSASPQRIIVMLYQSAITRLHRGAEALEEGDVEAFLGYSRHVREILTELRAALDHEVAPELCANLDRIYGWCTVELGAIERDAAGDAAANVEKIDGVSSALQVLLEGWQDVARHREPQAA